MVDGVLVQRISITMSGQSNVCQNITLIQVLQTYPPTAFFNHQKTQDVNITVLSDSTNWGIRNFRIAYKICDQSCAQCSNTGCLTCQNLLQLTQLKCNTCLQGFSPLNNNLSDCRQCSSYCLSCVLTQNNQSIVQKSCQKCQASHFSFQGKCQKHPNVGSRVTPQSWTPLVTSPQCVIQFAGQPSQKLAFSIGRKRLTNSFNLNQEHSKMLITFYLIKIDQWDPQDTLNLYINDLLVLSKKYGTFGNHICFRNNQTEFISFEEFSIKDSNKSIFAEFIVEGVNSQQRRFGIANFWVFPVGCSRCQVYDFNYKVQYTFDEYLYVQIIFNRIYVNKDAEQFKIIFRLLINNQTITYETVKNNSIRYLIKAKIAQQMIGQNVTVFCRYPLKVTTDVNNKITPTALFNDERIRNLQQNSNQNLDRKPLQTQSNYVSAVRLTPAENSRVGWGLALFLEIISRIVIYGGLISFFIGCQTPCTHFMHNLQKLWLHIYVASLFIPALLKITLTGFRQTQNQNIAINPIAWEQPLPAELYYNAPSYFQLYYTDISFYRNIYSVGLAIVIFLIFTMIAYIVFGAIKFPTSIEEMKIWRHMKVTFHRRLYFVINSILYYQYLTVCFACALQFIDLTNRTNFSTFNTLNAVAAVLAFIYATVYPLVHFVYLRFKAKDMYDTGMQISYRNRYHEIFYRFQPPLIWKANTTQFIPLNFTQRLYNLFRFGQIWFSCLIVALLHSNPFPQTFLLIMLNLAHLIIVLLSGLNYTPTFRLLKVLELLFFIGVEVVILISLIQIDNISTDAYRSIGNVGIAFVFVIVLLSIIRFFYTFYLIYREYDVDVSDEKKMKKVDWRLRNDNFYDSLEGGPIEEQEHM